MVQRKNKQYYLRKTHRYFGLIIGVQFLLWTAGGLYFSWSDMDVIHGDPYVNREIKISIDSALLAPGFLNKHFSKNDEILDFSLTSVLDTPYYLVQYKNNDPGSAFKLYYANSGNARAPINKEHAIQIASEKFIPRAKILQVDLLNKNSVNNHHEYRNGPLPAWAITFDHPSHSTLYIPVNTGQLQKIRISKWRTFDFLWMLHTMDYTSRDNFGNYLLKAFSIFGIFTILTGFILFIVSSPRKSRENKLR